MSEQYPDLYFDTNAINVLRGNAKTYLEDYVHIVAEITTAKKCGLEHYVHESKLSSLQQRVEELESRIAKMIDKVTECYVYDRYLEEIIAIGEGRE